MAALLLVFVWWSASGALPDSPFYNVKLASESVGLTFAGSVVDKARTHIGRANDRLYDLRIMQGRERLADSQPAFDNYSYNLDGATKLWEALQGQPRTDLAGLLYASSLAGKVTFQGFGGGSSALSLVLQQKIRDTETALASLNKEAAQTLTDAHIDPASILNKIDGGIPALLTPVASSLGAVPTITATGGEPQPATGLSPTVAGGGSATGTPSDMGSATVMVAASSTVVNGTVTPQPASSPIETSLPIETGTAIPTAVQPSVSPTGQSTPGVIVTATAQRTITSFTVTPTAGANKLTPTHTTIATSVPTSIATPTLPGKQATPSYTATPPRHDSTPTPTHTATLSPTTIRAGPTKILTDSTPTHMPTMTATVTPEPPVPPPGTPAVPTPPTKATPRRTSPRYAGALTVTPARPSATSLPEGNVCDLRIRDVEAACQGHCMGWTAVVENRGNGMISADWTAELQIKRHSGSFEAVATETGSLTFAPGNSTMAGTICYSFPPDTEKVRVEFYIDAGEGKVMCQVPNHKSHDVDPCRGNLF